MRSLNLVALVQLVAFLHTANAAPLLGATDLGGARITPHESGSDKIAVGAVVAANNSASSKNLPSDNKVAAVPVFATNHVDDNKPAMKGSGTVSVGAGSHNNRVASAAAAVVDKVGSSQGNPLDSANVLSKDGTTADLERTTQDNAKADVGATPPLRNSPAAVGVTPVTEGADWKPDQGGSPADIAANLRGDASDSWATSDSLNRPSRDSAATGVAPKVEGADWKSAQVGSPEVAANLRGDDSDSWTTSDYLNRPSRNSAAAGVAPKVEGADWKSAQGGSPAVVANLRGDASDAWATSDNLNRPSRDSAAADWKSPQGGSPAVAANLRGDDSDPWATSDYLNRPSRNSAAVGVAPKVAGADWKPVQGGSLADIVANLRDDDSDSWSASDDLRPMRNSAAAIDVPPNVGAAGWKPVTGGSPAAAAMAATLRGDFLNRLKADPGQVASDASAHATDNLASPIPPSTSDSRVSLPNMDGNADNYHGASPLGMLSDGLSADVSGSDDWAPTGISHSLGNIEYAPGKVTGGAKGNDIFGGWGSPVDDEATAEGAHGITGNSQVIDKSPVISSPPDVGNALINSPVVGDRVFGWTVGAFDELAADMGLDGPTTDSSRLARPALRLGATGGPSSPGFITPTGQNPSTLAMPQSPSVQVPSQNPAPIVVPQTSSAQVPSWNPVGPVIPTSQTPANQAPSPQAPTVQFPSQNPAPVVSSPQRPSVEVPASQAPAGQIPAQRLRPATPSPQVPASEAPTVQIPSQNPGSVVSSPQIPSFQAPAGQIPAQRLRPETSSPQAPASEASTAQIPSQNAPVISSPQSPSAQVPAPQTPAAQIPSRNPAPVVSSSQTPSVQVPAPQIPAQNPAPMISRPQTPPAQVPAPRLPVTQKPVSDGLSSPTGSIGLGMDSSDSVDSLDDILRGNGNCARWN